MADAFLPVRMQGGDDQEQGQGGTHRGTLREVAAARHGAAAGRGATTGGMVAVTAGAARRGQRELHQRVLTE